MMTWVWIPRTHRKSQAHICNHSPGVAKTGRSSWVHGQSTNQQASGSRKDPASKAGGEQLAKSAGFDRWGTYMNTHTHKSKQSCLSALMSHMSKVKPNHSSALWGTGEVTAGFPKQTGFNWHNNGILCALIL